MAKKKMEKTFDVVEAKVSYGMTLNIGNYESFRADAGCTVRARGNEVSEEEVDAMFEEGWKYAKEQLKVQVKNVRESTDKGKRSDR
jgi:hypothetical protein